MLHDYLVNYFLGEEDIIEEITSKFQILNLT